VTGHLAESEPSADVVGSGSGHAVTDSPRHRLPLLISPAALRARSDSERRPRWWLEITLIAAIYGLYTLTRDAVPSHEVAAFHRASTVLSIERWCHIDIEHSLNSLVARTPWLAYGCDYYYATLHFVVTIGVLLWLYVKHPARYRSIRTVLVITNLVALVGFFLPLAPPRMLAGYVDTVVHFHTWGSLASPSVANASNQFAAMPSLHIGWSMWCALAVITLARRRWVRVIAAVYPLATLFVILGTANHYVLDAVGGAVTLGISVVLQRVLSGRPAYRSRPEDRGDVPVEPEPEPELAVA
jgi:hypothetical protein